MTSGRRLEQRCWSWRGGICRAAAVIKLSEVMVEGKTTDAGANCCGFSKDRATAHF